MRPRDAQETAAILSSGSTIGLRAGSSVALRERIGHRGDDGGEQSRKDDGETHDEDGGLELVEDDLLLILGSWRR